MPEDKAPNRGEAAWREQRDAISKRNDEAHKRAVAERRSRDSALDDRRRASAHLEAGQLHDLNVRIAKRRTGGSR